MHEEQKFEIANFFFGKGARATASGEPKLRHNRGHVGTHHHFDSRLTVSFIFIQTAGPCWHMMRACMTGVLILLPVNNSSVVMHPINKLLSSANQHCQPCESGVG